MDEKVKEIIEWWKVHPEIPVMYAYWGEATDILINHISTLEARVENLEESLKLNASMLAKQTDLAREAEARVKELEVADNLKETALMSVAGLLGIDRNHWAGVENELSIKLHSMKTRIKDLKEGIEKILEYEDDISSVGRLELSKLIEKEESR